MLRLHQDSRLLEPLRPRKQVRFHLSWKQGGGFKYHEVFQCDNGFEFKSDVTILLEKHSVNIQKATTKFKHTHSAFVEASNKELAKQLFKLMGAQKLQDPKKISKIWIKNLNSIVNKMSNAK